MSVLEDLIAQVHATTEVEASALALIDDLAKRLDALNGKQDIAALYQLSAQLKAQRERLAAAIVANTPAAPAAPPATAPQGEPVPSPWTPPTPDELESRAEPAPEPATPEPAPESPATAAAPDPGEALFVEPPATDDRPTA